MAKPVYGLDDAGFLFNESFSTFLVDDGWERMRCDKCVFVLRGGANKERIDGILGLHVDDFACGGRGEELVGRE